MMQEPAQDPASSKAPYEAMIDLMDQVREETGADSYKFVQGISGDPDQDPSTLTLEQVNQLRVIFMTPAREATRNDMRKLVLGDQAEEGRVLCFSTSYSYQVLAAYNTFKKRYRNVRDYAKKFNMLLGFTDTLHYYSVWMNDHESGWDGEKMVWGLARMWKNLLHKSNEELQIDSEFTRPGVESLLEAFRVKVEAVDTYDDPPLKFMYC